MIEYIKLTDICNPKQWKTISGKNLKSDGYPVYGANGVIGYYNLYTHEYPTLMIGCRGTCGTLNISVPNSYINGNAMALDDLNQELIDIKYLFYYLSFRGFKDIISGSSQPQITRTALSKVDIPLIPMPLQMKIVNILDKSQELINKRKSQIEALDELIKNVFYDMFGDPYYNNKGYRVKKLKECIVDKTINGFFTANSNYSENGNVEVIWLSDFINNLYCQLDNLKKAKADDRERIKYKVQYGDILFCRSSLTKEGIGKASCIPKYVKENVIFECHIIKLRLDINEVIPEFFQVLSTTPYFRNQIIKEAKTSTMTTISQDSIEGCKIIVPPYKEQSKFLDFLDQVSKQKELLNESLIELENNFNSLMQRSFNGGSLS